MREFIDGTEAVARGALKAGCNFFAGYPITPATGILLHMVRELPKVGGIAIQAEDEIAAMGFCIGAALTGARVMTATSGPGISLYSEQIGAAIMCEVPLVIVDCQRMGPATGGATTVAQGDVQFLRWGTSGGYPVIVLAPTDIASIYTLTQKAFDLAERFRLPVFLAVDKELVLTSATVAADALVTVPVRERETASPQADYRPYSYEPPDAVHPLTPYGGAHIQHITASSHNEQGMLVKDPGIVGRLNRHLEAKVDAHLDEIAMVAADLQPGATTLLLSYGVSARSAIEAARIARERGAAVSMLTVHSLWPVPEAQICQALAGVERVIVPELNLGQYRREIERLAADGQEVVGVNRVDGELITPQEILAKAGLA
ncbi:MAG: pyruvate flavodoxin/ferredoxin oxidoreductase [Chloroflexota bacterium]